MLEAAELMGVAGRLEDRPEVLSGGEQQRVALARALVREPSVFLLDEPLSSLDALVRASMRWEIRRIQRTTGRAMLYVTHDQIEALTLGDRVAVLNEGVVRQEGTPDEIFQQPADRFVASFIGSPSMNLLAAEIQGDMLEAGPFQIPAGALEGDAEGPFEIGVRPEDVVMTGASTANSSEGTVDEVELAGSEAYVNAEFGDAGVVIRTPGVDRPSKGDRIRIVRRPRRSHVFRAGDGKRVGSDP